MKTKEPPLDSELQSWHPDPNHHEDVTIDDIDACVIADVIAKLKDENDRLRRMAALLSAETEYMRRSVLPAGSVHWRPAVHLRSVP
jgi:hypothetical protein